MLVALLVALIGLMAAVIAVGWGVHAMMASSKS
jgi:hypothetical protein